MFAMNTLGLHKSLKMGQLPKMGKGGGHPQQEIGSQKDAQKTECNKWQNMLRKGVLTGLFHPKKCWLPFPL